VAYARNGNDPGAGMMHAFMNVTLSPPRLDQDMPAPTLHKFSAPLSAAVGLLLLPIHPTWAQDAADSDTLQTIVVTAQKRSESIQQTPLSISAFDAAALKELGVYRATDLAAQVPNVGFSSFFGESQNPSFCFRSICLTGQFGDGFEPPVAMYTDEVYSSSAFAQALQLFDIERIEVLKGPQGTLYGRNTTGGLFNIITNKPTEKFESSFSAEYGTYNNQVLEGVVSGPLSDSVRGRLAAQVRQRDGWQKGVVDNGVKANDIDTMAFRGMLDIDLADNVSLLLSSNYFKVDQGGQAYALNGTIDPATGADCTLSQLQTGNCVGIFDDPELSANKLYGSFSPGHWYGADIPGGLQPRNYARSYGASATLHADLGSWELTSISSYSGGKKEIIEDLDGSINYAFDDIVAADADTVTQEIRASGNWGDVGWLLGAFYYDDDRNLRTELTPPSLYADRSEKNTTSWALYSNFDIPLAHDFKLILGGRYSWEKLDVVFNRSGDYASTVVDEHRSIANDGNFDGKVVLQWSPIDTAMLYGSITSGYRSANVNSQFQFGSIEAGSLLDPLKPVKPEKLISYETGMKLDLLDRRLRVNAALFYYDLKDKQTTIYVLDCTVAEDVCSGTGRMRNLDKVNVWGGEIELLARVTQRLTLNFSAGIVDSETKTDALDSEQNPLGGRELPMSNPSFNAGVSYNVPLAARGDLTMRADYSWTDDQDFSGSGSVQSQSPAYGLTSANLSWSSPSNRYHVDLFGENLFNEDYYIYAQNLYPDTQYVVWGTPRTIGLRMSWNY
jgi:iron complex outermembrane receptor protein